MRPATRPTDHASRRRAEVGTDPVHGSLELQGFRYHYALSGRETGVAPIILVSGAFQSMKSWSRFVGSLCEHAPIVTVDLPGAATADLLPEEYGVEFLVDALLQVIDTLGFTRVNVVAASYGTPIAYRLAQRYPERVERLVLAGVMRRIAEEHVADINATMDALCAGDLEDFAQRCVRGLLNQDASLEIGNREATEQLLARQLQRFDAQDASRYLSNTRRLLRGTELDLADPPAAPTLVFTGEHDTFTTPDRCREIAAALPHSTFTLIERADHLFHLEQFEVTLELIQSFVLQGHIDRVPGCGAPERTQPH